MQHYERLLDAIAEYNPTSAIEDLVWRQHAAATAVLPATVAADDRKVTELASRRASKQPTQPASPAN